MVQSPLPPDCKHSTPADISRSINMQLKTFNSTTRPQVVLENTLLLDRRRSCCAHLLGDMRFVEDAFLQYADNGWQVGWRDDRRTVLRTMNELKDPTCAPPWLNHRISQKGS